MLDDRQAKQHGRIVMNSRAVVLGPVFLGFTTFLHHCVEIKVCYVSSCSVWHFPQH